MSGGGSGEGCLSQIHGESDSGDLFNVRYKIVNKYLGHNNHQNSESITLTYPWTPVKSRKVQYFPDILLFEDYFVAVNATRWPCTTES